jgi:hypothetical protein
MKWPKSFVVVVIIFMTALLGAVGASVTAVFVRRVYGPLSSMKFQLYCAYGWGGLMIFGSLFFGVAAFFVLRPWEGTSK